jgi:hypothetical protein
MAMRHTCTACGSSCFGVNVRALDDAERDRMVRVGEALGVPDVWEDGRLRREDDRCVFFGADRLCRVHAAFGAEAKPVACRQYPMIAVVADGVARTAIDPGCYTHIRTWQTGEEHRPTSLRAGRVDLPPELGQDEARVLALADAGHGVEGLLLGLVGQTGAIAEGFGLATWGRLRAADWERVFTWPGMGRAVGDALRPALARWEGGVPPGPMVGDAFLVDAVRRAIHLRAMSHLGSPTVAAFLLGVGAWTAGRGAPDEDAAGAAFAGWFRALKARVMVEALLPERSTLGGWVGALRAA